MEIKTNYYYRSKDGSTKNGGLIKFNRFRITEAKGHPIPEKGVIYYSTSTDDILKVEKNDGDVISVNINRILTEKEYTTSQMEYYIYLNWINKQKFKWMHKRHFLQEFSYLHLGIIILLAYFVYQLIIHLTD